MVLLVMVFTFILEFIKLLDCKLKNKTYLFGCILVVAGRVFVASHRIFHCGTWAL